jgi:hypothetical protein
MVHARNKGCRGELQAKEFLKSLGFDDAHRTAQHNGKEGNSDVMSPGHLPNVHIEVKLQKAFNIGTKVLEAACEQARNDAKIGQHWVVLWRRHGSSLWLLTTEWHGFVVTFAGAQDIKHVLLQKQASA